MRQLSLCLGAALIFACDWHAIGQDQDGKLVSVTAREIKLDVPESWKPVESSSTMRVAEFAIPAKEANGEGAEMVVYYFGDRTGGTKANVQRWIDQFYEDGRQQELLGGKCRDGNYVWVSISGKYKKPDGPPAAQKTIDKPGSRVIGVVLIAERDSKEEYYFLKLSGPESLVASEISALRRAIGVEKDSEKQLKMDQLND